MNRKILPIFLILLLLVGIKAAEAIVEIDTDSVDIDFGFLNIGDWKELQEHGSYHNEITCSSTDNVLWYLKVHALNDFTAGSNTMPISNLKWKVINVINGAGTLANRETYSDMATNPQLIYQSGPGDDSGNQVKLRFVYAISIPKSQPAGNYRATIRFTMTEQL